MVHLISNNIKNEQEEKRKVSKETEILKMKNELKFSQILLSLFPDVEFEAGNNEEDDVNELVDESYQSSY